MPIEVQNLTNVIVDGENLGSVVQVARERVNVNIADLQTAVLAWFSAFKADKQAKIDALQADKDALKTERDDAVAARDAVVAAVDTADGNALAEAARLAKLDKKAKRREELAKAAEVAAKALTDFDAAP